MKKLLAILAIVLFATAAYADPLPPSGYANNPYYTNIDSRADYYYFFTGELGGWPTYDFWKDYFHGQPGNPYNLLWSDVDLENRDQVGPPIVDQYYSNMIQFDFNNQDDDLQTFMWSTNEKNRAEMYRDLAGALEVPDQTSLLALGCDWMDYPEYIGCTNYFFLFVYKPLVVVCLCEEWKCLGIYTVPSEHYFGESTQGNPFADKANDFSCVWMVYGQPCWDVVLSGEIITDGGTDKGVHVAFDWYGQEEALHTGLAGTQAFYYNTPEFHRIITLPCASTDPDNDPLTDDGVAAGTYWVGVVATSVVVDQDATLGVHTFEATVSGFYWF